MIFMVSAMGNNRINTLLPLSIAGEKVGGTIAGDEDSYSSAYSEERIHEMRLSFDSRAEMGEEARNFLRASAKGMSLDYRGLVSERVVD